MTILKNSRRQFLQMLGTSTTALFFAASCQSRRKRPNVLFIAVDDLRTELGCYGNKHIKSPNIDQLAKQGIIFDRAYCQQPICMASRASLLSGYRPDFARIYNCESLDNCVPDSLTLNKHFENNGYNIWASGKIYHHDIDRKKQWGDNYFNATGDWQGRGYIAEESKKNVKEYALQYAKIRGGESRGRGPAFESPDVPDNSYGDGISTDEAIKKLGELSSLENPFFMAMGYRKPHLPFNAPKKYWDLYSDDDIKLANNPFLPKNSTEFTPYNFSELRNYYGIPKNNKVFKNDLSKKLKHGYYACVSYIDAQIGRLLNELDRLGLRDNTIIVLWGDHGWKLGEHGMWCKHTQFELDAHVPMIFSYPGMKNAGKRATSFSEFVDIYPTLCDLAGIELPAHLQGDSLVPAMADPTLEYKKAAFTQWPKVSRRIPEKLITGYTLKYKHYSYTEWTRNITGEILAKELYDHSNDPNENENIADYAQNIEVVKELSVMLDGGQGWKKMRPTT
jgi:iduronate 2-sulfatase